MSTNAAYTGTRTTSTGLIVFNRTTVSQVNTDILVGTNFTSMDGTLQFQTTVDCPLASEWTKDTVTVNYTTIGAASNLVAGEQLQIVGPSPTVLLTITVGTGGLTAGVDEESDDALSARYLYMIQNPVNGGTAVDYQVWAEEMNGVTNVSVYPLARGNGRVDVVISDGGIPSANVVSEVQ